MCGHGEVKCEVKVIELKDGYQVQVTGGNVKNALKPENLGKCMAACCAGKAPFKDVGCR